jgi:hypothetical protein
VYEATVIDGELSPSDDVSRLRWFAFDDLPENIAFTGQRQAIHDWAVRQHNEAR